MQFSEHDLSPILKCGDCEGYGMCNGEYSFSRGYGISPDQDACDCYLDGKEKL